MWIQVTCLVILAMDVWGDMDGVSLFRRAGSAVELAADLAGVDRRVVTMCCLKGERDAQRFDPSRLNVDFQPPSVRCMRRAYTTANKTVDLEHVNICVTSFTRCCMRYRKTNPLQINDESRRPGGSRTAATRETLTSRWLRARMSRGQNPPQIHTRPNAEHHPARAVLQSKMRRREELVSEDRLESLVAESNARPRKRGGGGMPIRNIYREMLNQRASMWTGQGSLGGPDLNSQ